MSALFAQKTITGFAALALAAAGTALPGSDAKAAPLIFDCYSRSTSDLLMKSALDLSNENLACVQNGVGAQVSYVPAAPQQVYVTPAPAPAPSAGESFFGSMLGGAIGGVLGNAINGGNRTTEVHHHYDRGQDQLQDTMDRGGATSEPQKTARNFLPRGMHAHNPVQRKSIALPDGLKPSGKLTLPGNKNLERQSNPSGASISNNPSNSSKPSGVVLPGGTKIGGLNPSLGKLGSRLPF
ncbi:hypothetical protein [Vulcanococcus sp. Clear-D1]|uniref:hypothetical protein n=1 Tax=Vulcanococcus sp. Clear-D1 TaxID=2766970 RepID=UPI001992ABAD|nr:hypothetical protein [Vulcanococcus sp. Clear-D1]MBD1193124.1 hypothetical protein [Vulcanococcus sp. Clear-D1]